MSGKTPPKKMDPFWKGFWIGLLAGVTVGRGIVIVLTFIAIATYYSLFH